jgi:hypothetical protein
MFDISEKDCLDGDDLCGVYRDDKELRFYFPIFKERRLLKQLIGEIIDDDVDLKVHIYFLHFYL